VANTLWHATTLAVAFTLAASAQSGDCNAPVVKSPLTLKLPSQPFASATTQDGCWVFVSLTGPNPATKPGIAVVKRRGGRLELVHVIPVKAHPAGMAVTHDGKLLIIAAIDAVLFVDVELATGGKGNPVVGAFSDGTDAESIYANVSPDDKLLFISEERARSITVIDLPKARGNGFKPDAVIGKIPVGNAPIALTFSPDGKTLYTTSQGALLDWGWPKACTPEGPLAEKGQITRPEGAVVVVDVARAASDPAHAVTARVPAGCSPVRMAISPAGDRIYITARNSNAVLAFDTAKLLSDPDHARLGLATVGSAPVPIAVVDAGRKVVAGNSNRFDNQSTAQSLIVLDASKIGSTADSKLGTIPAGVFPRDLSVSADGRTLFLTNFGSNTLQVMNVDSIGR
jgi:DNA-binding beta-propeller fold protein YncE